MFKSSGGNFFNEKVVLMKKLGSLLVLLLATSGLFGADGFGKKSIKRVGGLYHFIPGTINFMCAVKPHLKKMKHNPFDVSSCGHKLCRGCLVGSILHTDRGFVCFKCLVPLNERDEQKIKNHHAFLEVADNFEQDVDMWFYHWSPDADEWQRTDVLNVHPRILEEISWALLSCGHRCCTLCLESLTENMTSFPCPVLWCEQNPVCVVVDSPTDDLSDDSDYSAQDFTDNSTQDDESSEQNSDDEDESSWSSCLIQRARRMFLRMFE
ncbi:hypothetical protein K2W90_00240 [Candidatus Babeliales bacterium]|nr:hypothetical protein [Candidatus Babeliales bacterium]